MCNLLLEFTDKDTTGQADTSYAARGRGQCCKRTCLRMGKSKRCYPRAAVDGAASGAPFRSANGKDVRLQPAPGLIKGTGSAHRKRL